MNILRSISILAGVTLLAAGAATAQVSLSPPGVPTPAPEAPKPKAIGRYEADGTVYVASRRPLRVGEIATVKIERADEYDLHGTVVGF